MFGFEYYLNPPTKVPFPHSTPHELFEIDYGRQTVHDKIYYVPTSCLPMLSTRVPHNSVHIDINVGKAIYKTILVRDPLQTQVVPVD